MRAPAAGAALALALSALAACAPGVRPPSQPSATDPWARKTLASLSLEEKAGQVVIPVMRGYLAHPQSEEMQRLERLVREVGVGGLIFSRGDPLETVTFLNRLQSIAKVPLLVTADLEWGAGIQVPHGATFLPYAMAVGATGSEALAEAHGRATAREGRALGIHMTFAPVVDVNNNPDNPIINIRSYGEDPAAVARLASAFVRGAHAGGLLTTAKHFPGHGDTAVDSHRALATVAGDRARLDQVELLPYRAVIEAGVDAVMVGHLAVPSLDATGVPATVSRAIVTDLLRGELGFRGLIVTDAMEMRGVADAYPAGEAAVRALQAGQDLVLMSPEPEQVRTAIMTAVREGRLSQARLDEAVLRLLEAKAGLGLHRQRLTPAERVWTAVGDPELIARMQELADRSITLVRNEGAIVPLQRVARLLHITLSGDPVFEPLHALPEAEVRRRVLEAETTLVDPRTGREELEHLLSRAREAEAVLVSAFVRVQAYKGSAALPEDLAGFLSDLVALRRPLVVVSYGSPYLLRQFPEVPGYICAYGHGTLSQKAAMKAVFGEIAITGKLPVRLPGLYPLGHGITMETSGGF